MTNIIPKPKIHDDSSIPSGHIVNQTILQSDWPRTIWTKTSECCRRFGVFTKTFNHLNFKSDHFSAKILMKNVTLNSADDLVLLKKSIESLKRDTRSLERSTGVKRAESES